MFLKTPEGSIGTIGGGRRKPTGIIDIAVMQSLYRKNSVDDIVGNYGQMIVDECHHIAAVSFEMIARRCKAKYFLGLSATVSRKDGQHPVIFMQLGPLRYKVSDKDQAKKRPFDHKVLFRKTDFSINEEGYGPMPIQEIYRELCRDDMRNILIVNNVVEALRSNRSSLVLTERKEHVEVLAGLLSEEVDNVLVLQGGLGKKKVSIVLKALQEKKPGDGSVLVATGRFIGEGFDDNLLDTLFLAHPVSWRGTLAQYVGRLHRLHDEKTDVIIYDYVDLNIPVLSLMHERRMAGYKAIGYSVVEDK